MKIPRSVTVGTISLVALGASIFGLVASSGAGAAGNVALAPSVVTASASSTTSQASLQVESGPNDQVGLDSVETMSSDVARTETATELTSSSADPAGGANLDLQVGGQTTDAAGTTSN